MIHYHSPYHQILSIPVVAINIDLYCAYYLSRRARRSLDASFALNLANAHVLRPEKKLRKGELLKVDKSELKLGEI